MRKLRITKARDTRWLIESFIDGILINIMYVTKAQMIALRQSGIKCEFGNTRR